MHFWGVRGSIPTPGSETARYGGNTSCISLSLDETHTLVLDAGSGLRVLGQQTFAKPHVFYFLLSHVHWDHIQGFPFFRPIMDPDVKIVFLNDEGASVSDAVLGQMDGVRFPITRNELKANIVCGSQDYQSAFDLFGVTCTEVNMLHEGACFGFRVTRDDGDWVYMTDNELPADVQSDEMHRLVDFASSADVLIHDAQYTDAEMQEKKGWGHSSFEQACSFAIKANVRQLVLFHHDPSRSDEQLEAMLTQANEWVEHQDAELDVILAREGLAV